MPNKIKIHYPNPPAATPEEIAVLQRFENILKAKLVVLTMNTLENYEWVCDETVITQRYFALRSRRRKEVILARGISELATKDPELLLFEVESEMSFVPHKAM